MAGISRSLAHRRIARAHHAGGSPAESRLLCRQREQGGQSMQSRIIRLGLIVALAAVAAQPAAAEDLQKVTIAFAGKGLSFMIQYIAMGGGFYKEEGLEAE